MPRPLRLDPEDGWHHATDRGVDRNTIFFDDVDRLMFGRLLVDVCTRFGIEVHAFCLMGNHFHLLLRCPHGGLSVAMHRLCSLFARFVNDRHGRVGHLFGDRFSSRLLTTHVYIANVVRYIHRNPLDIESVGSVEDYRWSSHRNYLGHRQSADWMHTSPVLGWFGGPAGFHQFVTGTRHTCDSTGLDPSIEMGDALSAIDAILVERSIVASGAVRSQRRAIGLALVDSLPIASRAPMIEALGISTLGAQRTAEWRARRFVGANPETSMLIDQVIELLAPVPSLLRVAS